MSRNAPCLTRRACVTVAMTVVASLVGCTATVARPPPDRIARTGAVASSAPPDPLGTRAPGDRSCANDRECNPGERCFEPNFRPGGGARPECEHDGQCPSGSVCDRGSCREPCTQDQCGPQQRCVDRRCEPRRCDEPGMPICPRNHRCDRGSGSCARIACRSASDCDDGVCWNGTCFAHSGYCMPQSYCCPP
jgi:hypothetical protein